MVDLSGSKHAAVKACARPIHHWHLPPCFCAGCLHSSSGHPCLISLAWLDLGNSYAPPPARPTPSARSRAALQGLGGSPAYLANAGLVILLWPITRIIPFYYLFSHAWTHRAELMAVGWLAPSGWPRTCCCCCCALSAQGTAATQQLPLPLSRHGGCAHQLQGGSLGGRGAQEVDRHITTSGFTSGFTLLPVRSCRPQELPWAVLPLVLLSPGLFFALNILWYYKILKVAFMLFLGSAEEKVRHGEGQGSF